ncbi:MAG TPA: glycosyltransferase [Dehalococcoidia bacterium]|nr:glycosyltransferase [Dehalococcoidia bacterium]
MLYNWIIAGGLIAFTLNILLNFWALKRPRSDSKLPKEPPLVSILIPTRDEEDNIEACLKSLQNQDYPNFEIIVLDDSRNDDTFNVVQRIAAADERISLFRSEPLPEGWVGKPFGCYQLAQKAKGSWLLFVDADTVHEPHMLRSVMAMAIKSKPGMLSGFPRQLASSWPQKIAIPVLYFVILSWFPLWWLQRSRKPKSALAVGQFLLFPKEAYWRIGGHKAVKARILEDVWLGVEITRHGGRHITIDLTPVVSCNMYRTVGEMWDGFVRWMYSVATLSRVALVLMIVAGYLFFLAPFYWLWRELFVVSAATGWETILIFSQVALIIAMRWLVDVRLRNWLISSFLHPIGFAFLVLTCIYGISLRVIGAGIRWKNRLYSEA